MPFTSTRFGRHSPSRTNANWSRCWTSRRIVPAIGLGVALAQACDRAEAWQQQTSSSRITNVLKKRISAALQHITLEPLVKGRRVAVKPNETWASADDTTGITQPDTLRAVLRALKHHHPRELIVTGGAGAAETDEGHPRSTQRHANHFFADMHSFIAAMARRFPIDLAITVGHPAMIGTGPLGGYAVETGIVITSTDALAACLKKSSDRFSSS